MVPVSIDFFKYREEVKRAILQRMADLSFEWDQVTASWLAYALSHEGFSVNQPLMELVDRLTVWAEADATWSSPRNLGALSLWNHLLLMVQSQGALPKLRRLQEAIKQNCVKPIRKISPLNDPEQFFAMALLVGHAPDDEVLEVKALLLEVAHRQLNGPPKRQILFAAALRELGQDLPPRTPEENLRDPGDVIAWVWCSERYGAQGHRAEAWEAFQSIKEAISLNAERNDGLWTLSAPEMALLYEALIRETDTPDPSLVFGLYPLHPRIREITSTDFLEGRYIAAVFEAAKAFEKHLKALTECTKSGRKLVQAIMGGDTPLVRFNSLQSQSEKDEQIGLQLMAEGVCAAIRNPKGHEPKDAPTIQTGAYEALDQLVIISYILKRVDQAITENGPSQRQP